MRFLTTGQAAKRIGVTQRYINAMIKEGRIKATPLGEALRHDNGAETVQPATWLIEEKDLELFAKNRQPRGRRPGWNRVKKVS